MYDFFFRCGKSCSHAAALAFKAEVALQTGLTKTASTSFLRQCNDMSRKKVNILQAFDYFGVFNNNASILNPYNYNKHTSLRSPNCSNYIFIWFQFHLWNLPWKPNCFHIDYFQLTISRPSHVSYLKSTSEEANMTKSWTHFLSLYQDYLTQTGKRRDRKSKLISQNLRPYNQMLLCFQVLRWKKTASFWRPELPCTVFEGVNQLKNEINMENFNDLLSGLLSSETVTNLEKVTVKQSKTAMWHNHRTGRITSSKMHQCFHLERIKFLKLCHQRITGTTQCEDTGYDVWITERADRTCSIY